MALETGTYINDLVATNPTSGDLKSEGDDHIRLIKATIKASFPNVSGAVTLTHGQLSGVDTPLTGTPTAPTQSPADNSTAIATTAYVDASFVAAAYPPVSGNSGKFLTNDGNTTSWADAYTETEIDATFAPLASPTFTGVPKGPTAAADTSTTQLATTAFVTTEANLKADLASPTFTGTPLAPTAAAGTNNTQVATTAFATTADNLKEDSLGNPATDGMVLASTAAGVRSWAPPGLGAMPSGLVMSSFVGGDASLGTDATNDIDFAIFSCMDSTNTVPISTTAVMTKRADAAYADGTTNGGMMNNGSYPFAAGKLYAWVAMGNGVAGDGDIGFLDTTDIANIAARVATAGYSYYKVFGFRHTLSGTVQWADFFMAGGFLVGSKASENVISTGITTTYATVDHSDFIIDDYTELIMYGVSDASVDFADIAASDDGTYSIGNVGGTGNSPNTGFGSNQFWIPYKPDRQFEAESGTLDLLLHGVKFRR